jgi:hypothetical protein
VCSPERRRQLLEDLDGPKPEPIDQRLPALKTTRGDQAFLKVPRPAILEAYEAKKLANEAKTTTNKPLRVPGLG